MTGIISWRTLSKTGVQQDHMQRLRKPLTRLELLTLHKRFKRLRLRYFRLEGITLRYSEAANQCGIEDWVNLLCFLTETLDIAELTVHDLKYVNEDGVCQRLCMEHVKTSMHMLPRVKTVQRSLKMASTRMLPACPKNYLKEPKDDVTSIGYLIRQPRFRLRRYGFEAVGRTAIVEAADKWADEVISHYESSWARADNETRSASGCWCCKHLESPSTQ